MSIMNRSGTVWRAIRFIALVILGILIVCGLFEAQCRGWFRATGAIYLALAVMGVVNGVILRKWGIVASLIVALVYIGVWILNWYSLSLIWSADGRLIPMHAIDYFRLGLCAVVALAGSYFGMMFAKPSWKPSGSEINGVLPKSHILPRLP